MDLPMDANQYYQSLLQQGHSNADAIHFTSQYYPEFQAPMEGAAMMAPPPPGSMELGGLTAGGMATGGGVAAAGAAAAGGMSVKTIVIVSVLVLGGVGTAGYFIYDYLTEPDFYGEIFWDENGVGYIFEEDSMTAVYPTVDGECDLWEEHGEIIPEDGLCMYEYDAFNIKITDKGNHYKICISEEEGDESSCTSAYPYERGMVLKNSGYCTVFVSDIETPNFDSLTVSEEWKEKMLEIGEEIYEEGPSMCTYFQYEEIQSSSSLEIYTFADRDAEGNMSSDGGDGLVHIAMTQGDDLSWALLKVTIVVDDGHPMTCDDAGSADATSDCTWTKDNDNYWSTGEEITISEGSATDLCDGSDGGCNVDITLTKMGIGDENDHIIGGKQAYADAAN